MPVETPSVFSRVIEDHLELKRRNAELEHAMPLERYRNEDPFENHPAFKTEEQARLEETMDGEVAAPGEPSMSDWHPGEITSDTAEPEGLWSRSRDFDWGD